MDVAGDAGGDLYVVHPGDSALTIENFSMDKGDALNISPSLQAVFEQTQVNGGVVIHFGGDQNQAINVFLKGVNSVDPSKVTWS